MCQFGSFDAYGYQQTEHRSRHANKTWIYANVISKNSTQYLHWWKASPEKLLIGGGGGGGWPLSTPTLL